MRAHAVVQRAPERPVLPCASALQLLRPLVLSATVRTIPYTATCWCAAARWEFLKSLRGLRGARRKMPMPSVTMRKENEKARNAYVGPRSQTHHRLRSCGLVLYSSASSRSPGQSYSALPASTHWLRRKSRSAFFGSFCSYAWNSCSNTCAARSRLGRGGGRHARVPQTPHERTRQLRRARQQAASQRRPPSPTLSRGWVLGYFKPYSCRAWL